MITREQLADLQPGDVVELHRQGWAEDVVVRGTVRGDTCIGELYLGDYSLTSATSLAPEWLEFPGTTLTVVFRAPRPLYVNHPRTKPMLGDVVSRGDTDGAAWSYCPRPIRGMGNRWRNTANDEWFADEDFIDWGNGLTLLVDGETGQVVP